MDFLISEEARKHPVQAQPWSWKRSCLIKAVGDVSHKWSTWNRTLFYMISELNAITVWK